VQIHVGNLSREVTEAELREAFEAFGQVASVRLVTDRYSGVSRGFGFVDMPDRAEAEAALEGLNLKEFAGRTMDLSEAHGMGKGGKKSFGGGRRGGGGRKKGGRPGGGRRRF
jgi:RNA recognition motif-containing protein